MTAPILQEDYNTQRQALRISEYGRHIQEYVNHIISLPDKDKRTAMATSLVQVMLTLNPVMKEQADARQKLWDHLHVLSDFKLDVDGPYPPPAPDSLERKPSPIPYNDSLIRFRFYGRNLQLMVLQAAAMEEGEIRQELINTIASFMFNSCRSWNNENLSNEAIAEHMHILSKGALSLDPTQLEVSQDNSIQYKRFGRPQQQQGGKDGRNKGGRFNKRNRNFRKY
jgi:hypothetical protein